MIRLSRFNRRRSLHWAALCKLDRDCGAPNDIDARLFGWHLLIRIPWKWW